MPATNRQHDAANNNVNLVLVFGINTNPEMNAPAIAPTVLVAYVRPTRATALSWLALAQTSTSGITMPIKNAGTRISSVDERICSASNPGHEDVCSFNPSVISSAGSLFSVYKLASKIIAVNTSTFKIVARKLIDRSLRAIHHAPAASPIR